MPPAPPHQFDHPLPNIKLTLLHLILPNLPPQHLPPRPTPQSRSWSLRLQIRPKLYGIPPRRAHTLGTTAPNREVRSVDSKPVQRNVSASTLTLSPTRILQLLKTSKRKPARPPHPNHLSHPPKSQKPQHDGRPRAASPKPQRPASNAHYATTRSGTSGARTTPTGTSSPSTSGSPSPAPSAAARSRAPTARTAILAPGSAWARSATRTSSPAR